MTSEDDFELMEIPLSPTNYEQPSTPEHPPPSALEAEKAIMEVLDNLRNVSISVSNLVNQIEIFLETVVMCRTMFEVRCSIIRSQK